MPSGPVGRRSLNTARCSMTSLTCENSENAEPRFAPMPNATSAVEQAPAPKHFPFPNTPTDNDMFYEILMFLFGVICAGLQFLHLYRTVWWLPHSHTSQALNFYLIDTNLVAFIMILLSRRLLYIVVCKMIERFMSKRYRPVAYTIHRLCLFVTMITLLSWCAYYAIENHPIVNILYLCYPVLVYLILFGCKIYSFFELVTWCAADQIPPLHACHSTAAQVRDEVESLKMNFNNRMKQILFSSVLNAYYTGFIPCCFAQNYLHYDVYWATQHVIFIFLSSFVAYASHNLSLRYCDILHRAALHLGNWDKFETRNMLLVNDWNEDILWPYGSLVKHGRDLYRAQGECNAGEPGNATYSRFYVLFKNPSFPLSVLLTLHVAMVLYQLVMLVRSVLWHNIISLTFLLFFNYYILYKMARDYLVSSKMYEEERAMHNKMSQH